MSDTSELVEQAKVIAERLRVRRAELVAELKAIDEQLSPGRAIRPDKGAVLMGTLREQLVQAARDNGGTLSTREARALMPHKPQPDISRALTRAPFVRVSYAVYKLEEES